MQSRSNCFEHSLDATNKSPHSLSEHCGVSRSHPKFPVERCHQYWQSLSASYWNFCGLALCQNRILFKLKIYWFKLKKKIKPKDCFAVFITKFVGGETLTFFKMYFFLNQYLLWLYEESIFRRLVLRGRRVLGPDDYHFLWITVHGLITLCKSNSCETNKNTCLHTKML